MICKDHEYAAHLSDSIFCYKCGKKLLGFLNTCPNGHEVMSIDVFCPKCGKRVNNPPVQPNALDPIREAQLENPVYPEDDEDALKDDEDYDRQEMDSHLHA